MNFKQLGLAAAILTPVLLLSSPARADVPDEPPSVTITSPVSGDTFDGPSAVIDVVLDASEGTEGIETAMLRVDDITVASDMAAPWGFEGVEVGEGMHTLTVAVVSSATGNEYLSPGVDIVVFGAADTGTDGGTSGDTGAGTSGTGGTDGGTTDKGKGCAVTSNSRLGGSGAMILLGLFSLGLSRRRRD